MPMPTIVGVSAVASGAASVVMTYPSGYTAVANDILMIWRECENADTVTIPVGWALVNQIGVASGTLTKISAIWKRAVTGEGAPTLTDVGDHQVARMIVIRGCKTTGNPWNTTSVTQELTADTTVSINGIVTTARNCLILYGFSTGQDVASTAGATGWANAALTNVVERMDNWVVDGLGGGFAMASGEKATPGATGQMTATLSLTANFKAQLAVALEGEDPVAGPYTGPTPGRIGPTGQWRPQLTAEQTPPTPFDVVQDWTFADTGTATSPANVTVNLGVPATALNTLLVAVNSDSTVSTPGGWSLVASSIHNAGCYLFAKIAAGGETGITVTPTSAASTCVGIVELAGFIGGTVAAQTDQTVSNGSATGATTRSTGTTGTTTLADEYAVALWGYSASQAIYPNGGADKWSGQTNSFSEKGDSGTTKASGTNVGLCVGVRLLTATGAYESTASTSPDSPPSESLLATFRITPAPVSGDVTITPATVAAVGAVPAPTVQAGAAPTPATVAAVASIGAPTVQAGTRPAPATVAAIGAVGSPTVQAGTAPAPATVVAIGGIGASSPPTDATVTPATVPAVGAIAAPTVQAGTRPAPATVAAVAAIGAPTVQAGSRPAPATVAAVGAIGAPTVRAGSAPAPATVAAVGAVGSPTMRTDQTVPAVTVAAVGDVPAPSVTVGGSVTITPAVVAATAAIGTPTMRADQTAAPATLAATGLIGSPTVRAGTAPAPATVAAVGSIGAPTVQAGTRPAPATVAALGSIGSAIVRFSAHITPATVAAAAAVGVPGFIIGTAPTPDTVAGVADIGAPLVIATLPTPGTFTSTVAVGRFTSASSAGTAASVSSPGGRLTSTSSGGNQ